MPILLNTFTSIFHLRLLFLQPLLTSSFSSTTQFHQDYFFLLSPGWILAYMYLRVTTSIQFAGTHSHTWAEKHQKKKQCCSRMQYNNHARPGLKSKPLNPVQKPLSNDPCKNYTKEQKAVEIAAVIILVLITRIKLNSTQVIGPHAKSVKFEFQIVNQIHWNPFEHLFILDLNLLHL